jgi:hypothetical protein
LFCCCREDELVKRANSLVVNSGAANDADLGPVISRQVCFQTDVCVCLFYHIYHFLLHTGNNIWNRKQNSAITALPTFDVQIFTTVKKRNVNFCVLQIFIELLQDLHFFYAEDVQQLRSLDLQRDWLI